jgi:hypothetical protein
MGTMHWAAPYLASLEPLEGFRTAPTLAAKRPGVDVPDSGSGIGVGHIVELILGGNLQRPRGSAEIRTALQHSA